MRFLNFSVMLMSFVLMETPSFASTEGLAPKSTESAEQFIRFFLCSSPEARSGHSINERSAALDEAIRIYDQSGSLDREELDALKFISQIEKLPFGARPFRSFWDAGSTCPVFRATQAGYRPQTKIFTVESIRLFAGYSDEYANKSQADLICRYEGYQKAGRVALSEGESAVNGLIMKAKDQPRLTLVHLDPKRLSYFFASVECE